MFIYFWLGFLGSSILILFLSYFFLGHPAHFPRWGYTALLCAVKKSQTGTVAALLKIGAKIEHEDRCLFKVTLTKVGRKLPGTRIMDWKSSTTRYGCTALLLASRWSKTPQIQNWPTLFMILSLSCCSLTTLTRFAPEDFGISRSRLKTSELCLSKQKQLFAWKLKMPMIYWYKMDEGIYFWSSLISCKHFADGVRWQRWR